MRISEDALNIITAQACLNADTATLYSHYRKGMNASDILGITGSIQPAENFINTRKKILSYLQEKHPGNCKAFCFVDDDFPISINARIADSQQPLVVFCIGDTTLLKQPHVCVIGTRQTTPLQENEEQDIIVRLIKQNIIISSGLAIGCDTIAMRTALQEGGKVIAVLPSTLHNIIPHQNTQLASQIAEQGGLVVTEYWLPAHDEGQFINNRELTNRYIRRDSLMALMSKAVLLAASADYQKGRPCGSRHALKTAARHNIQRSVIYNVGNHSNPLYGLNRRIIQEDQERCIILDGTEKSILLLAEKIKARSLTQPSLFQTEN